MLDLTGVLAGPTRARSLAEQHIGLADEPAQGLDVFLLVQIEMGGELSMAVIVLIAEIRQARTGDLQDVRKAYRPGTLGDRGFSPEALVRLRPGIVFVSLCAFAKSARGRGFDTVVQAVSGISSRQGSSSPVPRQDRSFTRCRRSTI